MSDALTNGNGRILNVVYALFLVMICAIASVTWVRINGIDDRLMRIEGLAAERGERFRNLEKKIDEVYEWMRRQPR